MKKLFYITLAFLPMTCWGQIDRSIVPTAGPAPSINIKDSEVFKTPNGITVILSENHKIPKVSFQLSLGADPIPEGIKAGLSDIMGDLIMSGTTTLSKDQLDNKIDYIGATLNASSTGMFLSVMKRYQDQGLVLMSDLLANATFPESEFNRIVKQAESGLKAAKSEPSQMANNASAKINFSAQHPYSEVMTEESLKNITVEDVKQLYSFLYVPEGSYLVIVGDITKDQATAVVDKYFTNWNGDKAYKGAPLSSKPAKGSQVAFVNKPGAVQSVISVCIPMNIAPGHPDQIGLSVLNQIFGGGGFGTRLMQNLREDKAYTYGCYANQDIDEHGSLLTISGNFRNEVTDSAITQILYEIQKITSELGEDEELATTKASMAGSFARSLESPQTIARFARNIEKYGLDKDYYKNYLKTLAAVSKEDVLRLAKKYMSAENVNIIVVGNEEVIEKLQRFDQDGTILKLDAFGNEVKETKAADITVEQLFERHILALTNQQNVNKAQETVAKIKAYEKVSNLSSPQIPVPLKLTEVWLAPNAEGSKMEGQGMVFQKSYFDGKTGASTNMQTGTTELSAEEIAAKAKSIGLVPEMNYTQSGMKFELKGIEIVDGREMYVVFTDDGKSTKFDYYDQKSMMKMRSIVNSEEDGQTVSTEYHFSNFTLQNGIMVANAFSISVGPMSMDGVLTSFKVNDGINLESFK